MREHLQTKEPGNIFRTPRQNLCSVRTCAESDLKSDSVQEL